MISLDFAMGQIERLGGMYRFPDKYPAAVADLAKALAHYPETTEEIATAVIDSIKDTATAETPCPMPSEIRAAVNSHLDESRWDPECPKCGGCGTIMVTGKDGYEYGKGCDCLARRPAPDYAAIARKQGLSKVDTGEMVAAAADKLRAKD